MYKKECLNCHKTFIKPKTRSVKHWQTAKYCCRLCKDITQKGKPFSEETKLKLSLIKIEEYKSGKRTAHFTGRIGVLNYNWKHGKTKELDLLRHSKIYHNWRKSVYKRDYWTCQKCNKHCKSSEIIAHHVKSFTYFPNERFSIQNGVTLCRSCHLALHNSNPGKIVNVPKLITAV